MNETLPERKNTDNLTYAPESRSYVHGWNATCDVWELHVTRLQSDIELTRSISAQLADRWREALESLESLRAERKKAQADLAEIKQTVAALHQEALEVAWAIEECGASFELTNAVTKASALARKIERI